MMTNFSVATWRTLDLFNGDPTEFIDFHESVGAKAICIKVGNGKTPWEGLSPYIDRAKAYGMKAWGWWFMYGHSGEEEIMASHASALGLDGLALDVESQWERNAGITNSSRRNRAQRVMSVLRNRFPGELALCSWWKPSYHKAPVRDFLAKCDWNMPQMYWIGRRTVEGAANLVSECLDEYARLANFMPQRTIPILASYGQNYTTGGKQYWWKVTLPQMASAYNRTQVVGCPSVNWWSLDYLQGGAGHEAPKVIETRMIDTIKELGGPSTPVPGAKEAIISVSATIRAESDKLDNIAEGL